MLKTRYFLNWRKIERNIPHLTFKAFYYAFFLMIFQMKKTDQTEIFFFSFCYKLLLIQGHLTIGAVIAC